MLAVEALRTSTKINTADVTECLKIINKKIATAALHRARQTEINLTHHFLNFETINSKLDLVIAELRTRGYTVKLNPKKLILRVIW